MPRTAVLLKANHNRVYGDAAPDLGRAELALLDQEVLHLGLGVERVELGGVSYLLLDHDEPLGRDALAVLSNLSSLHALFGVEGALLRPLPVTPLAVVDDDITTIQRYQGKTNEAFTHLLVNLALAAGDRFAALLQGERLNLLDPACGRGTTLNRAAVYGLDAAGVEIDQRAVEHWTVFFLTWLKDHRFKHRLDQAKLRKGREHPAHRITVTYGATKDRASHRVADVVHDDTRLARTHFRDRSFDLLVCDLPYGVQHGAAQQGGGRRRGPGPLLAEALPEWHALLRPGAGVALAFNRRTLARGELEGLVVGAGFELVPVPEGVSFAHRVDHAIQRDVVIARRPASGSCRPPA